MTSESDRALLAILVLNERQLAVLHFLAQHRWMASVEIAFECDLPAAYINNTMWALYRRDLVEHNWSASPREDRWRILATVKVALGKMGA